jgi:predicted RNA-binding protein with PUA-like domain
MAKKASANSRRYWLFKSEPDSYSIEHLKKDGQTFWSGVRNYQARNTLRDDIAVGDGVLFYHSSTDPMAVVGTMTIVKAGYPDPTAFDSKDHHFDPKSKQDAPTWFMVDVKFAKQFKTPVTRDTLKADKRLKDMVLLKPGSRLSIQPVTAEEWQVVHELAGVAPYPSYTT